MQDNASVDLGFDSLDYNEQVIEIPKATDPCVNLWRMVLYYAIHDLVENDAVIRKKALRWLSGKRDKFIICDYADIDITILNIVEKKFKRNLYE